MLLGNHFVCLLALVCLTCLALVEGQNFAATRPKARSNNHISEDKTEELNMDTHSDGPSSLHYSVPDVDHSKRSSANNLLANINSDFIWTEKPLSSQITSNVDITSSKQHAVSFVNPYPVSGGTASSKSGIWINVRVNGSYTPQRFGPNDHGRTEGSSFSKQAQYKGHVTDTNPFLYSQTDGNQHGVKMEGLSKNAMKINEGSSTVRAVWLQVNPSENMPLSQLTPVISKTAGNLRVMDVSKSFLQPHSQLRQRPLFQQPWRSHVDILSNVQSMKEAHSGGSKSFQRQHVLSEEGTTQQGEQTTNYQPANLFRVKAGYASEIHPPFVNTKANIHNQETQGPNQFQDIHRTSQPGPFATHLPTLNSATNRGVFSYLHFPSSKSSLVQSQKTLELSQSKPDGVRSASQLEDKTIYSTSASQPDWRFLDTSKSEGDVATFFGNSPVTPSLSDYSRQPNIRKLLEPENIPNSQNTRTAQWLVIKPYSVLNSAREAVSDRVHLSSSMQSIFERSQSKKYQDMTGSTNFHVDRVQAPQTTELRSNMQMIPSLVPDAMQHVTQGTGSSRRTFTGYQTARSDKFNNMGDSLEWKPQTLSSFNKEDWSATIPLVEGTSGRHSYPQTNPTQYKLKVLGNLDIKGSKDHGYMNKSIFFRPRTLHDLQMKEQMETSSKGTVTYSGFQSAQSERSYGLSNLDFFQNTEVSPVGESAMPANEANQSIKNPLSINSSQISKLTAIDTGKTPGQGISAASSDENTHTFSEVNSSSPVATGGDQTQTDDLTSLNESNSLNESLYFNFGPQTISEDKNISASESIPASLKSVTPQYRTGHMQAKTDPQEALYLNQDEVKPENEHQIENEEQANTEQQSSSHDNATQNSRPTSTVAVSKRIKVTSRHTISDSQKTYEDMQLPIYRSPIIRRKSKNRLANISVDLSKEGTKPENQLTVDQSPQLTIITESTPAKVEGDSGYSDLTGIPITTNIPVHDSDDQQRLNSSQSFIKKIKPKPITFSDVAGSASISIYKPAHMGPMLNGIVRHSNLYRHSESPLRSTTTESVSAAAGDGEDEGKEEDFQPTSMSVTEAPYALEDGMEPSPTNLYYIP